MKMLKSLCVAAVIAIAASAPASADEGQWCVIRVESTAVHYVKRKTLYCDIVRVRVYEAYLAARKPKYSAILFVDPQQHVMFAR
jgi:hypothetical protein